MKPGCSFLLALVLLATAPLLAKEPDKEEPPAPEVNPVAIIKTNKGDIHLELFATEAPKTVKNFLDLAEGRKEYKDPKTGEMVKGHYFDGLTFHRVIAKFMIQGGCPLGTGMGSPGFSFEDEINATHLGLHKMKAMDGNRPHPWLLIRSQQDFQRALLMPLCRKMGITDDDSLQRRQNEVKAALENMSLKDAYENMGYEYSDTLKSSKPEKGVIAMANSGPKTNGSQFFINLEDTPHLTGKHTVFGRVVKGMEVVEAIGKVPVDGMSRPLEPVKVETVREKK